MDRIVPKTFVLHIGSVVLYRAEKSLLTKSFALVAPWTVGP